MFKFFPEDVQKITVNSQFDIFSWDIRVNNNNPIRARRTSSGVEDVLIDPDSSVDLME